MKNKPKFKSSKLLKSFEIGKSRLALMKGGNITYYIIIGSEGCSQCCPDSYDDNVELSN